MNGPLNTLLAIVRLRRGPQDLPASWSFTIFMLVLYALFAVLSSQRYNEGEGATTALAISAMQFIAVAVMLQLRKFPERLPQTLSALAGAGIILGLASLLFLVQADPGRQQPLLALAWFSIFFWSLVVDGHIYRHALSISLQQGILVSVLLLAASFVITEFLFNMPDGGS